MFNETARQVVCMCGSQIAMAIHLTVTTVFFQCCQLPGLFTKVRSRKNMSSIVAYLLCDLAMQKGYLLYTYTYIYTCPG